MRNKHQFIRNVAGVHHVSVSTTEIQCCLTEEFVQICMIKHFKDPFSLQA